MYARLIDSVVVETFTPPEGFTIDHCFTSEVASLFIECLPETKIEDTYLNGHWSTP